MKKANVTFYYAPFFIIILCITLQMSCQMNESKKKGNHLVHETSPYLLQHAYNPVDWYPWGEEALEKAKTENKMMIISIGYAACHWCHVMEHESFEDDSVASIMNENFICIKVDREERPDIDDVYMTACHLASGGSCGWPLNAFALPDGRPVWAGTYFPRDRWKQILNQFSDMFSNDLSRLERSAEGIVKGINVYGGVEVNTTEEEISDEMIESIADRFLNNIDFEEGGSQGQPKFPMPDNYDYLLKYYNNSGNPKAHKALKVTLDKMADGGIYDQIGGGFARYSVDGLWRVPHFEKMLYDNGQLMSLYADAFRKTKDNKYLNIAVETADFVLREMTNEEGGFYSSYDADSEGEEGTFYVWRNEELDSLLGADADLVKEIFSCTPQGNWEGKNILYRAMSNENYAANKGMAVSEVATKLEKAKKILFVHRSNRERPGLDDKVLTSWNGLGLSGIIAVYKATGDKKYLDAARINANFISNKMIDGNYRIYRNYKEGRVSINGFLDDYANVIKAFLEMYELTFEKEWLETGKKLMLYAIDHFTNDDNNMFFYTSDLDPPLIARKTDYTDNVIPGSNSVMAHNLLKLGTYYGNNAWEERSRSMVNNMIPTIASANQPGFYSNWCKLMLHFNDRPFEIAIMGSEAVALKRQFDEHYLPQVFFLGGTEEHLPLLEHKLTEDVSLIYVCKNKVCKFPVESVEEALKQM
jgi:uncharacterized protein YyaL (SSP411 family)